MKIKALNASAAPQPKGAYSQAIEVQEASRFLFISGQLPETIHGESPTDFKAQARLVWANLFAQLEAAGMSVSNLVTA
jgi:enamine deaminase RidA (YjgF/YER057c/UK114 family)